MDSILLSLAAMGQLWEAEGFLIIFKEELLQLSLRYGLSGHAI